jgi:hypothetical protein
MMWRRRESNPRKVLRDAEWTPTQPSLSQSSRVCATGADEPEGVPLLDLVTVLFAERRGQTGRTVPRGTHAITADLGASTLSGLKRPDRDTPD